MGWRIRVRAPTWIRPASSRSTESTVGVQSGHRSTLLKTSQTRSGAAWIVLE